MIASRAMALQELPEIGDAAVTMGVFDGVHLGHQALLGATQAAARNAGAASVALVFDPHPDEVVKPGTRVPRLAPLAVTLRRIGGIGLDHALPIRFDDELRQLSAEDFLGTLASRISLRRLVMTPESAFGRERRGTVERMRAYGAEQGFEVVEVEPRLLAGAPISSSMLRQAVAAGDLATVRSVGRPAYLQGRVIEGDHRGRELGYPTANLAFDYFPAMPPRGIYTGRVAVPERGVGPDHPALVSIGVRPTFHEGGQLLVEVHLLDYDGDLYGAELELELLDHLRDERRFDGPEALIAQMRKDEADARRLLGLSGHTHRSIGH